MSDTPAADRPAETEAHMPYRRTSPIEVAVQNMTIHLPEEADSPETEAHMPFRRTDPSKDETETEAHGFSARPIDPEAEAYGRLRLTFPPDAPAQTFELRYRPPAAPGDEPEVELHLARSGR